MLFLVVCDQNILLTLMPYIVTTKASSAMNLDRGSGNVDKQIKNLGYNVENVGDDIENFLDVCCQCGMAFLSNAHVHCFSLLLRQGTPRRLDYK